MAKEKTSEIVIDDRRYKVRDVQRSARQRVGEAVRPTRLAASQVLPVAELPPARETQIKPVSIRNKRQAAVFHGGRSDKSISRKQQPAIVPMSREEMREEYKDRALKYGVGGAAITPLARVPFESRKSIRPMVDEWDKARRRMQGHVLGRMTGSARANTLTPEEYAQTVRRNAGMFNRMPRRARERFGPSIIEGLGPGNYGQHAKVVAFRGAMRLGLPLAGVGAAGLQYLYDRNRKHYRVDYQGRR